MIECITTTAKEEVPSAQHTGHWEAKDDIIFATEYYCSNCGNRAEVDLYGEWILSDYCPWCGADMRGGSDGTGFDRDIEVNE